MSAVLLASAAIATSSCTSPPAPPEPAAAEVPDQLRGAYPDAGFATASAVTSGTVSLGVALIDTPQASDSATVTVVGWLTSDSDGEFLVYSGKYWELLGFSVIDEAGSVIADEFVDNLMLRGGGPVSEQIGAGAIHTRELTFELPGPGRYAVVAHSMYEVMGEPEENAASDTVPDGLRTQIEVVIE